MLLQRTPSTGPSVGAEPSQPRLLGTIQYRSAKVAWEPTGLPGFWLKALYEERGARWERQC